MKPNPKYYHVFAIIRSDSPEEITVKKVVWDIETAEKKYREVLEVVPKEDDYYEKAELKLKKLTIFKRAGNPEDQNRD